MPFQKKNNLQKKKAGGNIKKKDLVVASRPETNEGESERSSPSLNIGEEEPENSKGGLKSKILEGGVPPPIRWPHGSGNL